jgi:hypothetical protein
MARTTPIIGKLTYTLHHPLEVCIRKNIYTWEMGAGLGWVVIASASINYYVMTRTSPIIGKLKYTFTPSFRSMH